MSETGVLLNMMPPERELEHVDTDTQPSPLEHERAAGRVSDADTCIKCAGNSHPEKNNTVREPERKPRGDLKGVLLHTGDASEGTRR